MLLKTTHISTIIFRKGDMNGRVRGEQDKNEYSGEVDKVAEWGKLIDALHHDTRKCEAM